MRYQNRVNIVELHPMLLQTCQHGSTTVDEYARSVGFQIKTRVQSSSRRKGVARPQHLKGSSTHHRTEREFLDLKQRNDFIAQRVDLRPEPMSKLTVFVDEEFLKIPIDITCETFVTRRSQVSKQH